MDTLRAKGYYEHPVSKWQISVRIEDPWHDGNYFLYRMPEVFFVNKRRYISQPSGVDCWPAVQPEAAPEWSLDENERISDYHIRFYDGIELSASAEVINSEIEFSYKIKNGTEHVISVSTGSCFMTYNAPYFIDRRHERTFIFVDNNPIDLRNLTPTPEELEKYSYIRVGVGKPLEAKVENRWWSVREAADNGLVCLRSRDGKHSLGLGWANAHEIMARSTIPCLHSEPVYPSLKPGKTVETKGRLYFSDNDISSILNRFTSDIENNVLSVGIVS